MDASLDPQALRQIIREEMDRSPNSVRVRQLQGGAPVAVLPAAASVTDGQVIRFQSPAMLALAAPAVPLEWELTWSSAMLAWVVRGGPLSSEVLADEVTAVAHNAYQDLATVGPQVTLPLAGDYEITLCATMYSPTVNEIPGASVKLGAAATSDSEVILHSSATASAQDSVSRTFTRTGLAAGAVIKVQYKAFANNLSHFARRNLIVRPIRVTG